MAGNAPKSLADLSPRVEAIRGEIATKRDRIRDLHLETLPLAEAKANVRETFEALRITERPGRDGFTVPGGVGLEALNIDMNNTTALSLVVRLFGTDRLAEMVSADLDQQYAAGVFKAGLPLDKRHAARLAIEAEIHALEVEEEQMIEAAEASGLFIDRRPDADPAVFLNFRNRKP